MIKLFVALFAFISLVAAGLLVYRRIEQRTIQSIAQEMIVAGGISEVREVTIGGISQYIALEGRNVDNPICLFLHGGPGLSTPFGITARTQYPDLTSHCTVVYWDQRGAGKTYNENMGTGLLTLNQLQNDAVELVTYLLSEFDQQKLYLFGYSWGSVLGIQLTQIIPNQIEAYFGIGQVVHPADSDVKLYKWLLDEYQSIGAKDVVATLKQIGIPPYYKEVNQKIFSQAISQSEAYIKRIDGSPGLNILKWIYQVIISPDLTLGEVYDTLFKASYTTLQKSVLWKEVSSVNFVKDIESIKIPVYFISGIDDYICSKDLLLEWSSNLKAPKKEVFILESSAHYPSASDERTMFEYIKEIINRRYPQEENEEVPIEESILQLFN